MPPRVSTGDRDAVLRQIRWCAAVQTLVNCHCQLEENPVGNVEPMQLVVQYLTDLWLYRAGFNGRGQGPGTQTSHQQRASHQTVHIVFLANDRCLRDYDLVVVHC